MALASIRSPSVACGDATAALSLTEERVRMLQEEEKRNRTRSKLLDEELLAKQAKVQSLVAQQDERRTHLRALEEEIHKKQTLASRLAMQLEDRSARLQPLDEQCAAQRQAQDALAAQQEVVRQRIRDLEADLAAKQRGLLALGDHSAEVADKQGAIAELLERLRALQGELERARRHLEVKQAQAAHAETNAELVTVQVDRLAAQLKALETEYQQKREQLEKMQAKLEDAQGEYVAVQSAALQADRALARQRLERQLAEEEQGRHRQALQDRLLQYARAEAELSRLRRKLRGAASPEELEAENAELRERLAALKQELTYSKLAVDDSDYQNQLLETMLLVQRHPQGSLQEDGASAEATAQLVDLLRRQEDRITQQQHDLVDLEGKMEMARTHAAQEQELRAMIETELQVASAELQMELGRVQYLHKSLAQQDMKLARYEVEQGCFRTTPRTGELGVNAPVQTAATVSAVPETEEREVAEMRESIRRQQELLSQIQGSLAPTSASGSVP